MGRITYVCATCSEHFTRKYSATRHNLTLHDGRGEIVRLPEYLAGRSSRQNLPSHPSWYRRTQKWDNPTAHNYNSEFGLADSGGDMFRSGNGLQQTRQGNTYKNSYYSTSPILQATHKSVDPPYETQFQARNPKIKELKTLLDKWGFPYGDTILRWAVMSAKGDENYLEEKLVQLRKIGILRN
ncbi:MAG: hypothetical protein WAZ77_08990 [Candidatus Nitrosopolaris sp.]